MKLCWFNQSTSEAFEPCELKSSSKCAFVVFQNLESKLASCRDYINEQAASCRSRGGGQGTPSGCGDSSESQPTNGLYNKG